jgi:V/A-type H+-transporting ATPase subunit E
MAIDDVIAKIEKSASSKREEILIDAEKEKQKILTDWQNKASDFYGNEKRKAVHDAENEKRSIVLAKRLELRKDLLSAKQKLIDTAFDRAYEKIKNLKGSEYEKLIEKYLSETAEGAEEVIFRAEDKAVFEKALKKVGKDLKLSSETRKLDGGFILKKGKVETNVSIATLFKAKREELENEVGKLLNVF